MYAKPLKRKSLPCRIILNPIKEKQDVCVRSVISYESSSEEEAVLIHVEFASHLQDFGTHLEAEEQLVYLK